MRVLNLFNMKGGVGKTVTAVNTAAILATDYGQRVLLIDADAQANATNSLLSPGECNTLELLLRGEEPYYENLVYPSTLRSLDVMPAGDGLRALTLSDCRINAIRDLCEALAEDDAYDWVVIDCPPDFPPACVAAMAAGGAVVVPMKLDRYSMDGMAALAEQIHEARMVSPDLHIAGWCSRRLSGARRGKSSMRSTG